MKQKRIIINKICIDGFFWSHLSSLSGCSKQEVHPSFPTNFPYSLKASNCDPEKEEADLINSLETHPKNLIKIAIQLPRVSSG